MSRVFLAYSKPGKGKTTFSLSGGKTAYFEMDAGSYDRATKSMNIVDGMITVTRCYPPLTALEDLGKLSTAMVGQAGKGAVQVVHRFKGWREAYGQFLEGYLAAIKTPEIETIVIDTSTMAWKMAQNAFRQRVQDEVPTEMQADRLKRLEYEEPGSQMDQVVKGCKMFDKNLVLIAHEGEVWFKGEATGEPKPDGWGELDGVADVTLRFTVEGNKPVATITKVGGADLAMIGIKIPIPTIQSVSDLIDGAAKLRKAGMSVPGKYEDLLATVEALAE